ncbi:MAG TPA: type II secretion system protein GspJ, partial [Opitutaceae bacterium]|nr:type II secretion system protein GspJ [Opitutaceae bacterium]
RPPLQNPISLQRDSAGLGNPSLRSRRGFTLLEILIATAVSAIVLVAISTVFYGALRLRTTTTDHIEDDLTLQRTLGLVRNDLAGLMLPGGTLSGALQTTPSSTLQSDTAGERISPDFYTDSGKVDGWNPYSEVQMVTYYLAAATDGSNSRTLVRSVMRNLLPAQDATPDDQLLLPGVTSADFLFYDGTEWTDTWDSTVTSTLPTAVKFRLQLASQSANASPIELVVPVFVTTTTSAAAAATTSTATGGTQ